ncbi:MAG: heme ABC transporter ATP-binding protein [Acidimicrobiia bacterium]
MSDAILSAVGVTYSVDGAVLVDGVDLEGRRGELIALCGPNGAGKSTLLRILAGDLSPHPGRVVVDGFDTSSATPAELARARAVMRQGGRSDIPFTAIAVVEMGRYPHRSDPDASRAADIRAIRAAMERTETDHLAGRIYATLSGGEQTRVVMARILAQDAPVVLLDEPTTALDVAHQERVLAEVRRIADEGSCVIAVLHDLNAASYYADRVVMMADARIAATGTPTEVLRSDLLNSVYGQEMTVVEHPTRNCPLVIVT